MKSASVIWLALFCGTQAFLGGAKKDGPSPIVTPIQFPGILNPSIYLQNTQSAPIFPQLNAPPVNLNLHVNGLEEYYRPKQRVIHKSKKFRSNYFRKIADRLSFLEKLQKFQKKHGKPKPITINIDPEAVDDLSALSDPNKKMELNKLLTETQRVINELETEKANRELRDEIEGYKAQYVHVKEHISQLMKDFANEIALFRSQKEISELNHPQGKMDFGFLKKLSLGLI